MELKSNIYGNCIFFTTIMAQISQKPARFIANAWQEAWFTDQKYSEVIYDRLSIAITGLECTSAHTCLKTHWVREPSLIDIPRSNMVAERAVKVMEELHGICKTD